MFFTWIVSRIHTNTRNEMPIDFNRCPNATFPRPRQCPGKCPGVKNQTHQITSKLVPLERARKTKHFSYENLGLKMSRSKGVPTLIWSRDPTLCKLPKVTGLLLHIEAKLTLRLMKYTMGYIWFFVVSRMRNFDLAPIQSISTGRFCPRDPYDIIGGWKINLNK